MDESWKVIPQAPDYEVSSLGRVRRCRPSGKRPPPTGFIKQKLNRDRYLWVRLIPQRNAEPVAFPVHRLVAEAFCEKPATAGKLMVAHWDGERTNNAASNLRWTTAWGNKQDDYRHGRIIRGEQSKTSKLTDTDIEDIRWVLSLGAYQDVIAKEYGVSSALISLINRGHRGPSPIGANLRHRRI